MTYVNFLLKKVIWMILLFFLSNSYFYSQCLGTSVFKEDFGAGTGFVPMASLTSGATTTYTYFSGGSDMHGDRYTISNNPVNARAGSNDWFNSTDHTGNTNGRMLLVNAAATAGIFFRINNISVLSNKNYSFNAFFANVARKASLQAVCGSQEDPVNLKFRVESTTGVLLGEWNTGNIYATNAMQWRQVNFNFNSGSLTAVNLIIQNNNNGTGCGNDLAIDDVSLTTFYDTTTVAPPVNTNLTNVCPTASVNLNSAHTGTIPQNATLVWYTTANRSTPVLTATQAASAGAGTYYAFYYDASGSCYSPASSAVTVTITPCCQSGTTAPSLSGTSRSNVCPATTVNLNTLHNGTVPTGATLVWFTNSAHTGTAYATPTAAVAGTYYAFYYDSINNCYSPASSAVTVTITPCCQAGTTAPSLVTTNAYNVCPATTVNLNALHNGTVPTGAALVWFTNNTHTGAAVATPTTAPAGTYYAFYYDVVSNCYSPASNAVTVTTTQCSCYKPGVISGTALDTTFGISALGRAGVNSDNWPMVRKGAWAALESKTKGFVINRLSALQIAAIPTANLIEGMMVYDTTNNCLKVYTTVDGTTFAWSCMNTQTCPD